MKLSTFKESTVIVPRIDTQKIGQDAAIQPMPVRTGPRQAHGNGLLTALQDLDAKNLSGKNLDHRHFFSIEKNPIVLPPQSPLPVPASPAVDRRHKTDAIFSEASPISLKEYINLRGYSQKLHDYTNRFKNYIEGNDLRRYDKYQTSDNQLGSGSSKVCFDVGNGKVLVVKEKSGSFIEDEMVRLQLLRQAGFPTVEIYKAGKIPDRFSESTNQAMVQEKLRNFFTFDRVTPEMHRDFINSEYANQNTLDSLKKIRHLMRANKMTIGDLQGGIGDNGDFHVADPTYLNTSASPDIFSKKRMENMDAVIRDLELKLHRAKV